MDSWETKSWQAPLGCWRPRIRNVTSVGVPVLNPDLVSHLVQV
ncbi:hypothetical protein J1605_010412 [Eschrichtius robustus]|uniref:Uncharacterized protein n=1 Tax=Eschrichtius robustus TaxID=9764 RepID=A0AB34GSC8_ESCRO|nr:hypothetical protein J1605_010412 [Eschrichtius robustus]